MSWINGILLLICGYGIYLNYKKSKALTKIDTEIKWENARLAETKKLLLEEIADVQKIEEEGVKALKRELEHIKTEQEFELRQDYETVLNECQLKYEEIIDGYNDKIFETENKMKGLTIELQRLRSIVDAANQANLRAQEIKEEENFYRIVISEDDVTEIKKIREIEPFLRDKTPLNKVIWNVYYQNPFNALCGRVSNSVEQCGIYKITNSKNGMIYIGQSKKILNRWKEHVKKGIGADAPTKNKLYPAMLNDGVENFTFEILEVCTPSELNERESFWINYYNSKILGYNATVGNKEK